MCHQEIKTGEGGEYTSIEFSQFYEKEIISHEMISTYILQHNVITKRKNKSVLDMA